MPLLPKQIAPWAGRAARQTQIEGLAHGGVASVLRKAMTSFGSGWRGIQDSLKTEGILPTSGLGAVAQGALGFTADYASFAAMRLEYFVRNRKSVTASSAARLARLAEHLPASMRRSFDVSLDKLDKLQALAGSAGNDTAYRAMRQATAWSRFTGVSPVFIGPDSDRYDPTEILRHEDIHALHYGAGADHPFIRQSLREAPPTLEAALQSVRILPITDEQAQARLKTAKQGVIRYSDRSYHHSSVQRLRKELRELKSAQRTVYANAFAEYKKEFPKELVKASYGKAPTPAAFKKAREWPAHRFTTTIRNHNEAVTRTQGYLQAAIERSNFDTAHALPGIKKRREDLRVMRQAVRSGDYSMFEEKDWVQGVAATYNDMHAQLAPEHAKFSNESERLAFSYQHDPDFMRRAEASGIKTRASVAEKAKKDAAVITQSLEQPSRAMREFSATKADLAGLLPRAISPEAVMKSGSGEARSGIGLVSKFVKGSRIIRGA